jgi:hypothetical protein
MYRYVTSTDETAQRRARSWRTRTRSRLSPDPPKGVEYGMRPSYGRKPRFRHRRNKPKRRRMSPVGPERSGGAAPVRSLTASGAEARAGVDVEKETNEGDPAPLRLSDYLSSDAEEKKEGGAYHGRRPREPATGKRMLPGIRPTSLNRQTARSSLTSYVASIRVQRYEEADNYPQPYRMGDATAEVGPIESTAPLLSRRVATERNSATCSLGADAMTRYADVLCAKQLRFRAIAAMTQLTRICARVGEGWPIPTGPFADARTGCPCALF